MPGIREFYVDKSVFITGASGFMGKVLLEKILYSIPGVKEVFILMRAKKGKSAAERVEEMTKSPCFQRIHDEKPEVLKKITPVWGDITQERLGLNDEQFKLVTENTHITFHLAASLRLEATLKPNIEFNLLGTQHVLDVCKSMKKLLVTLHLSTAFCNSDHAIMEEKVYDWPHNPKDLISCARWMSEETMHAMSKSIMGPHPNTYTFTKRLAEILVRDEFPNLPVCIVRPSIVSPAWREPLPGWVDSLNGPVGVTVASGKGVIRSLQCDLDNTCECIAVDQAIAGLIGISWKVGSLKEKPKEIPVFNVTCSEKQRMTWRQIMVEGYKLGEEYPCEVGLWYPNVNLTKSYINNLIHIILFMWIPAYFIDFLMVVFRQKPFLVRVQKRISVGLGVLTYFAMTKWDFKSKNFMQIDKELPEEEREIFHTNTEAVDALEYMTTICLGGRQYCMKEPLSTLPKARRQMKVMWVVDKVCKGIFLYFFFSFLFRVTGLSEHLSKLYS